MIADLEVWLIGTTAELDQAATALSAIGRTVEVGTRRRLTRDDNGRARLYLRLAVVAMPAPKHDRAAMQLVTEPLDITA
jgi:hypothetical protein